MSKITSLKFMDPISVFAFSNTPGIIKLSKKIDRLRPRAITIKPMVVGSLKNLKLMYPKAADKTNSREIIVNVSIA